MIIILNDIDAAIPSNTKRSAVTAEDAQSAAGRQRSVYKVATDKESAQPSSLPPAAACEASSLRSTGNVFIFIYTVPLSDSVKTLGFLLDSPWRTSLVKLPNPSAYYHLRRISGVKQYLSTKALVKLHLTSLILSGLSDSSVHTLRRIQNWAVRLIPKTIN